MFAGRFDIEEVIRFLMEFGWGIWTPYEMAALSFHARAELGQYLYSTREAVEGIPWVDGSRLNCGPCGLSRTTWHRVNSQLEKAGVLTQTRRTSNSGASEKTGFAILWGAVAGKIENYRLSAAREIHERTA